MILSISKNEWQAGDISVVNAKIFKPHIGPLAAFRAASEFTLPVPWRQARTNFILDLRRADFPGLIDGKYVSIVVRAGLNGVS